LDLNLISIKENNMKRILAALILSLFIVGGAFAQCPNKKPGCSDWDGNMNVTGDVTVTGSFGINGTPTVSTVFTNGLIFELVDENAGALYGDFQISRYAGAATTANIQFAKAAGSRATPTAVDSTHEMGGLYFHGHDGTTFDLAAQILGVVDAVTANEVSGRLQFQTANTSGTRVIAMSIDDNQNTIFNPTNQDYNIDTTAQGTIAMQSGVTAPAAGTANVAYLYAADRTTDKTGWVMYTESGTQHIFSDRVGINTIQPESLFHVMGNTEAVVAVQLEAWGAEGSPSYPLFDFKRANYAGSVKSIVVDGDTLGWMRFRGHDGSGYHTGAEILVSVDGTPSDGTDMPTRITMLTTPDGSATPVERIRINNAGAVDIEGSLTQKFTVTTDTTDGAGTHTIAEMLGRLIIRSGITAGSATDVTDTATNIVGGIDGCIVGSGFEFSIQNQDADSTIILDNGTDVTMLPNDPATAIPADNTGRFLAVVTNCGTPAVNVHALGYSVH
jgi:hypothetical protein